MILDEPSYTFMIDKNESGRAIQATIVDVGSDYVEVVITNPFGASDTRFFPLSRFILMIQN